MEEKVVQSLPEREFQSANSSIISQVFQWDFSGLVCWRYCRSFSPHD